MALLQVRVIMACSSRHPLLVMSINIIGGEDCWLLSPLEACVAPSSTMRSCLQGGGVPAQGPLYPVSEVHMSPAIGTYLPPAGRGGNKNNSSTHSLCIVGGFSTSLPQKRASHTWFRSIVLMALGESTVLPD